MGFLKTPVVDRAITSRVLQVKNWRQKVGQRILPAYYRVDQTQGLMITHNHINSQRSSTGLQHFNRLGMAATEKLCLTFEASS